MASFACISALTVLIHVIQNKNRQRRLNNQKLDISLTDPRLVYER